jgi:geranylgeranyl diphosphate synthase type I
VVIGVAQSASRAEAGREVLAWARELTVPALREAVALLPAPQRRIVGYHRGWNDIHGAPLGGPDRGGKMVRPALVLLSALAVGGTAQCAVPGAVAVELVHDFSLLHDDVIDGDRLRRHRPAVWAAFGIPAAVLAGDALLVRAVNSLSSLRTPGADAALRELSSTLEALLRGQSEDVVFEGALGIGVDQYLRMAAGKTGSLMGCACALGGTLAGAPPGRVEGLRDFGRHLGVAFQCVDDLLGIWGSSERSGKPVGADVRARKMSLPVLTALADEGEAGARLAELYGSAGPLGDAEVELATALITRAGGREATQQEADRQIAAAMRALSRAEPAPAAYRQLHDFAMLMSDRSH